jgi:hypothetical protein
MAETSDQILEQIEHERSRLGKSIDELEMYVREKMDLRAHFLRKPWAFLAGAAVSGLVLATMLLPNGSQRLDE